MKRIRTGWRLAKDSWALLRADRSLAVFPLLSTASRWPAPRACRWMVATRLWLKGWPWPASVAA